MSISRFASLNTAFINATKRILVRDLSRTPTTLKRHEDDLFESYNKIISLVIGVYSKLPERNQIETRQQLFELRDKFKICAEKLGLILELDNNILAFIEKRQILQRTKYNEDFELLSEEERKFVGSKQR